MTVARKQTRHWTRTQPISSIPGKTVSQEGQCRPVACSAYPTCPSPPKCPSPVTCPLPVDCLHDKHDELCKLGKLQFDRILFDKVRADKLTDEQRRIYVMDQDVIQNQLKWLKQGTTLVLARKPFHERSNTRKTRWYIFSQCYHTLCVALYTLKINVA